MSQQDNGGSFSEIAEKSIKKICPNELKKFNSAISKSDLCENLFLAIQLDDGGCDDDVVDDAYVALCNAFKKATGLTLSYGWGDPDISDLDGRYWAVHGVYQYTPNAKKFLKEYGDDVIQTRTFIHYDC